MTGLVRSLTDALKTVTRRDEDSTVVALALEYAMAIDDSDDAAALRDYGPKLLAALIELRMTPKARSAVTTGPGQQDGPVKQSPSDELRARRAGKRGAPPVDEAAP